MGDILSFQVGESDNGDSSSIWDTLKRAVEKQIKADKIKPSSIQPGETERTVFEDAVENVYYDVSAFYYWIFEKDDERRIFTLNQKPSAVPTWLRNAVEPVVQDNLEAMREVGEIPADRDNQGLEEFLVNTLSRYIVNWEDWYYDRKEQEAYEGYLELISMYRDVYIDTDYGNLTNVTNIEDVEEPPYTP